MKAGYFQPITAPYRIAWMWWVILVSFQQVLFLENNLTLNWLTTSLIVVIIVCFYFLVRQRRFFIVGNEIHFTQDFRLTTTIINIEYINSIKVTPFTVSFVYVGKEYRFFMFGRSNELIRLLLENKKIIRKKKS
ncbi:EbsA family protein [Lactococcus fujiensis]|nr:EbsA family protein [Lactococcus fujiensis]